MGEKLVIRNIGTLLSGDLVKPLLAADTIVAVDGRIVEVGEASAVDTSGAAKTVDARGTTVAPGPIADHVHPGFGDWTPRPSQRNRIEASLHSAVTPMPSAR